VLWPQADDAAALRDNAFFTGVEGTALGRLLPAFVPLTLPKDAVLYGRGPLARRVFLIVRGRVALIQRTARLRTTVAVLGPGEFTGERSLVRAPSRQPWSAVCCEESRIAVADGEVILNALAGLPVLALNVAHALHRRVRDASLAIDELIAAP